jgi:hypothetical protein
MTYIPFGRRYKTAAVDSGFNPMQNPGNWTCVFQPQDLNLPQGQFEVVKGKITGGQPYATFAVYLDSQPLDGGALDASGSATFYKGSDAEFLISGGTGGGTIYFYFSDAVTDNLAPLVTLWLCFDREVPINQINFSDIRGGG